MRARVYDNTKNKYYISEVYAEINMAGDWYAVDDIDDKDKICIVKGRDFDKRIENIEIIDENNMAREWVYVDKTGVAKINDRLKSNRKIHYYRGDKFLWENDEIIKELLETGFLEKKKIGLSEFSSKEKGWNYIEYEASIIIKDCKVYFYDSDISDIRENYDGMYFVSMGMMWRYT